MIQIISRDEYKDEKCNGKAKRNVIPVYKLFMDMERQLEL